MRVELRDFDSRKWLPIGVVCPECGEEMWAEIDGPEGGCLECGYRGQKHGGFAKSVTDQFPGFFGKSIRRSRDEILQLLADLFTVERVSRDSWLDLLAILQWLVEGTEEGVREDDKH